MDREPRGVAGARGILGLVLLAATGMAWFGNPATVLAARGARENEKAPPPEGLLVVLNKQDNSVSFIETRAGRRERDRIRLIRTLPTGESPHEVAIRPDGREAWVSNAGANTIGIYDLEKLEQTGLIRHEGFGFPHGSAFTPDGEKFYVACTEANAVFVIDASSHTVLTRIPTNQKASHMVAMAPGGGHIYVPNIESRMVTVISTSQDRVVGEVRVGRGPEGIALTMDGTRLMVANQEDSTMSVIDTAELRVIDAYQLGEFPVRVIVTPDGTHAFTADRQGNTLTVVKLDEKHARVLRRVPIGKSPGGMAFDGTGRTLFVALNDEAKVILFDVKRLKEIRSVRTGKEPDGIAFVPGWQWKGGLSE